jgi:hypothetical protein
VGQALTDAPDEFRVDFQAALKSALRKLPDVEVLDFVGLENGTALDVFHHDQNCTQKANLCIFLVDYASIGLGMEIMIRHQSGGQMLFFARTDRRVTRMLTGFLENFGRTLCRYEDVSDIIKVIEEYIAHRNYPD